MQLHVLKEGWLDITTDRQPGTDKWDKANCKRRYCVLQHRDGRPSLKVYDNDKKTGTSHTLQLDTAFKAAKRCRGQVVTEDGTVLCVMEGKEHVIPGWVVSLNSVITTASTDKDITQHTDSETDTQRETDTDNETAKGEDAGTARHRPQKLSDKPYVIKEGWLNILTDPARGKDKLDNMQREYCVLRGQGDRYRLEVYNEERDWRRRTCGRNSYTHNWTGNVATVCLDTARHAQLCSTRYEVVTIDGGAIFVMDGTDDSMTDWVVSLNRAIMTARCQGNSESHDDVIGVDRDDSDDGTLEQGLRALSPAQAENEFFHAWFPDLDAQSYIIPRVHYGTVHVHDDYDVGGHKGKLLKTDKEIKKQRNNQNKEVDVVMSIDDILKRVHYTMNTIKVKIAPSEVMVIMTEAKCGLYTSLYAGAADRNNNNTERGGASKVTKWDMKRDPADLLVVHRDHGLLLGAVIKNTGSRGVTTLCEDMGKAVAYLDKAEAVVNDVILPGVAGGSIVAVNKTILLPNLKRANLQTTIDSLQPEVRERLERCVGVQPGHDVTRLCLTKDDMADEQRLKEWWTACLKHDTQGDTQHDTQGDTQADTQGDTARMGDEVYRALVAKFAVPLMTVEMSLSTQPRLQLWTAGHVVHAVGEEHGRDLTRIALFPRQVELLLEDTPDDDDVRILHGGPGTAKTILLLLRSLSWYRDGCDTVFNIQTENDGQAAAYLVSHQLRETVARARQGDTVARPDFTVQQVNMTPWRERYKKDWTEEGRQRVAAWCDDAARSEDRKVHIIADEANGHIISHLYRELKGRGCTVKLWAAGVQLGIPDDMKDYVRKITAPLRCPPSVVREVKQAYHMEHGRVPPYTEPPVTPPCDGPPVITILHYGKDYSGDREGHQAEGDEDYPWRCEECGRRVARLLHTLHLGRHDNGPGEQGGLRYNDVFIMGAVIDCGTNTLNSFSPAPFIRGLRQLGIPTRVVHHGDSEAVIRVAENSWTPLAVADAVTIVHQSTVWGLERKVVVYLDGGFGDDADRTGRLVCMSRSTAQLVWVRPRKP